MDCNPSTGDLIKGYQKLSDRYRDLCSFHSFLSNEEVMAYEVARKPATEAVLRLLCSFLPPDLKEALDVGAGPGTSYFPLKEIGIKEMVYLEKEERFFRSLEGVSWMIGDAITLPFPSSDLVLFSYSLGESQDPSLLVRKAYEAAKRYLVLVEPGTPRGFSTIQSARQQLLDLGAIPLAPCFHEKKCPKNEGWCHFSLRLSRSKEHRKVKLGTLGYEDEPYSYFIASKEVLPRTAFVSLVERPKVSKHSVELTYCSSSGIQKTQIDRSNKELFKIAKKKKWGEIVEFDKIVH